jgi:hypothetical protein
MPIPSRSSRNAPSSKRRGAPLIIVLTLTVAVAAFLARNHGGIVGYLSGLSFFNPSSAPEDSPEIPSWMRQPFDKQAPLTHTVQSCVAWASFGDIM